MCFEDGCRHGVFCACDVCMPPEPESQDALDQDTVSLELLAELEYRKDG